MSKKFETPTACESGYMIRFLNAKDIKTIEIHLQIFNIYGEKAASDSWYHDGYNFFAQSNQGK